MRTFRAIQSLGSSTSLRTHGRTAIVTAAMMLCHFLPAQAADIYYFFEEESDSRFTHDSSGNKVNVPYAGQPQNSARTTENARFGQGSMKTGNNGGQSGFSGLLPSVQKTNFCGSIQRMSIVAWVKPDKLSTLILFRRSAGGSDIPGHLYFSYIHTPDGNGTLRLGGMTPAGSEEVRSESISLAEGEWNHIAVTFNEGRTAFYVNGMAFVATSLFQGELFSESADYDKTTLSGMLYLSPQSYVDDFGFFGDRVLSDEEIHALYADGLEKLVTAP